MLTPYMLCKLLGFALFKTRLWNGASHWGGGGGGGGLLAVAEAMK